MDLGQFAEMARKRVQERIKGKGQAEHTWIERNNQVVRAGIGVRELESPALSVLNVEAYYEQYQCGGIGIEEAMEDICQVLAPSVGSQEERGEGLLDYQKMKEKIVFRLISREKNQERLGMIPHIPFLDMEIEFRLLLSRSEWGQREALISQELCRGWHMGAEGLFAQAKENMVRLYPPRLQSMDDVMRDIATRHMEEMGMPVSPGFLDEIKGGTPLYVLSNQSGIHGAGTLLYPGLLKGFADSQGSDVVILPSSIHEVLLVPFEENFSFPMLRQMVRNINGSEVPPEDQLSDQVYLYQREKGTIQVAE